MYKYTHGGDIYALGREGILDFSANISPFGLPDSVKKAMAEAIGGCDIYPDPDCRELRAAIAKAEAMPAEKIFCASGAADILCRIAAGLKPAKALLPVPSFGEYEETLAGAGCDIEYYYMREDEDFHLTERFLSRLSPGFDIVFLCNPNNPTGHVIKKEILDEALKLCDRNGILAVVDECFIDFLDDSACRSVKMYTERYEKLIVIKAFTKIFAMAGVRLGYCFCGDENVLGRLHGGGQPWSVSTIAQKAGAAAAEDTEYVKAVLRTVGPERERLKKALSDMGCKVFDSRANFVFFRKEPFDVDLKAALLGDNILIRSCGNYRGLPKGYYRVAVKTPAENDILIESLRKRV